MKQVVVLCGGQGKRLKPLTNNNPKPMVDIHGKPFLLYLLKQFKHYGVKNFLFLTGYKSEKISDYFSKKYSHNIINKKFLNQKKEAKKLDLDTYVLKNAKIYLRIFNQYISLFTLSDFTLIKYNTMINNPKRFQSLLAEIFDLDQSKKLKISLKKNLSKILKKIITLLIVKQEQ